MVKTRSEKLGTATEATIEHRGVPRTDPDADFLRFSLALPESGTV